MLASAQQNQPVSQKPFVTVSLVIDPPEGIKALNNIKLKEPTLLVKVEHGNKDGILNTEWIPLHLKHEFKTPVDQKTRYGKKIESKAFSDSPLEPAPQKRDFDLREIANFNHPRTQRNKLIPVIRSAPGSTMSEQIALCIPTSSGECRLVLTPEGNVRIDRLPIDLDLTIETLGTIKTGADLKCHCVCLTGKNIENSQAFVADTMDMTATKKLINTGTLSGKKAVIIAAAEAFMNQPNAVLISENGLVQIKDTSLLTNQGGIHGTNIHLVGNKVLNNSGRVEAQQALSITTNTHLTHYVTGTLKSGTDLTLDVLSMVNAGVIEATKTLVADSKAMIDNQVSGRIFSQEHLVLRSEAVQNSGEVRAEGSLTCEADKIIQTLRSSRMRSEKELLLKAKSKLENAGILSGKESANMTAEEVLINKPDATVETNGLLVVETPFLDNAGKITGQIMTSTRMTKLKNQGNIVFQESLKLGKIDVVENTGSITTPGALDLDTRLLQTTQTAELSATTGRLTLQGDHYNAGKIIIQNLSLKTGVFENTATGILQAETLSARATNIDNAGTIQSTESCAISEANTIKNKAGGVLAAKNLRLSATTLENPGDLQGDTVAVTTITRLEQAGTVTAETLTLTAPGVVNTGVISANSLRLPKTNALKNKQGGTIQLKILVAKNLRILSNDARLFIAEQGTLVSKKLKNRGIFQGGTGSHLKISVQASQNRGEMRFNTLEFNGEILQNEDTGKILAEKLSVNINTINNQGMLGSVSDCSAEKLSLGGVVNINASELNNLSILWAGHLVCHTQNEAEIKPYSFNNQGTINAKAFQFRGKGLSHTAGQLIADNIIIHGLNIQLIATTQSPGNIKLQHDGGIWEMRDEHLKCSGELIFDWQEGVTITEARVVAGSLRYILSPFATKPLVFLANQTAESGSLTIDTQTTLIIGDNEQSVTLKSNQPLILKGQRLDLQQGRLLSVAGIQLQAMEEIVLGSAEAPQVALLTPGSVQMSAHYIKVNQLEMICGGNFEARGRGDLVNISSQIQIKGDAIWAMRSRHQLLVKADGTSAAALTKPSTVIIEGKLNIMNHSLEILGSQISCTGFEGDAEQLKIKSFTPFTTVMVRRKIGEHRRKHTFHGDDVHEIFGVFPTIALGAPINASFSIGTNVKVSVPHFEIAGIFSAIAAEIRGIQQGLMGQFDERFRLAPMLPKLFQGQVPLMNYFNQSLLYEISPGGETVFKSVLPFNHPMPALPLPALPRMLLSADGTLSVSPAQIRRLFPREKEAQLLTKVMLGELGRGFLNQGANTPQSMLQFLEANTLRYSEMGQKLIIHQSQGMLIENKDSQGWGVLKTGNVNQLVEPLISEPCIVDILETLVFKTGHTETVLSSIVLFPKHYDNRRLRDGAGCVFTLGDITFSGVPGSELHMNGHIDATGLVTYENLGLVSRRKNSFTRYETIRHESKQKSLMGKNKTTATFQSVAITALQPGNEMVAGRGVRFRNVDNIYFSGARDALGPEGLIVENANSFIDAAMVSNKIGTALTVKQRGCLGMGGMSTSVTPILQEVIGTEIKTAGPIHIQARYGQFDASQFRGASGEAPTLTLEISVLHFHELLATIEANNRANQASLLSALKEQARTAKRKSRQSTTLLLISLPVSYYTGALISSYLQSAMGVTLNATLVKGVLVEATASVTQAATIVSLSGMGSSIVSAAIQGQSLRKAAINGALFSFVGDQIAKAPVLAGKSQCFKDVASGIGTGTLSAALHHGNMIEGALIGGVAPWLAATVVPGANKDLSVSESLTKIMVGSTAATALSGGNVDNLVRNLASGAMGAIIEPTMWNLGLEHGVCGAASSGPQSTMASPAAGSIVTKRAGHSRKKAAAVRTAPVRIGDILGLEAIQFPDLVFAKPSSPFEKILSFFIQEAQAAPAPHSRNSPRFSTKKPISVSTQDYFRALPPSSHRTTSPYRLHSPKETLTPAELRPYTAPWFKRFAKVILGDQGEATQQWQASNQRLMVKEKAFIGTFTARQQERFSTPSLLPTHQNPSVEGGLKTFRAVGRGIDNVADGLLHLDRLAVETMVLSWDASGAAAKLTFGTSTTGSEIRNAARIQTLTQAFNHFMSADVNQKLDIITEMSATVALGGALTKLPLNLPRNTAFTKPAPLSEGMLSLYRRNKQAASLALSPAAFPEVALVQKSLQSSKVARSGQGGSKGCAQNNFNISSRLNPSPLPFTPAFNEIKSFSTKSVLDGELYPKNKLSMLINYLEKRGTYVYGTEGAPHFVGKKNGAPQIYFPENPTTLQVKHELSHWLDFKKLGYEEYSKLAVYQREKMVLERLQENRIWKNLNQFEKDFSLNYVEKIKLGYKPGVSCE